MKTKRNFFILFLMVCLIVGLLPTAAYSAETKNYSNYVVFAKFAGDTDQYIQNGFAEIKKAYEDNSSSGVSDTSFKNYLYTVSRGKLRVDNYFPQESGGSVSVLNLSMTYAQYSADQTKYDAEIVKAVITYLNSNADITNHAPNLGNPGASVLDNLTIVLQTGGNQENEIITAHMSSYGGSEQFKGYKVSDYNIVGSSTILLSSGNGSPTNIIHEFMHSLGLPDLYRASSTGTPVGSWDIMADTTSLINPLYPLAQSRESLGWLNIEDITTEGTYTLNIASSSTDPVAYRLRTPLSDTQSFYVEYRKKNEGTFDASVPENGLLVYRVDESVSGKTNYNGKNYVYVFRPEPTVVNDVSSSIKLMDAAFNPDTGETSFGSTDLSKAFNENTIYYADGANSGIAISNIRYVNGGAAISFDVAFADYDGQGYWELSYTDTTVDATTTSISADDSGNVYAAYGKSNAVGVMLYNGTSWSRKGSEIANASKPTVLCYGSDTYLSCLVSGKPVVYKLGGNGSWAKIYEEQTAYWGSISLYGDDQGLYVYYDKGGTSLMIYDLLRQEVVSESLTGTSISNPALCRFDGKFYVLYLDSPYPQNIPTQLKYLTNSGSWEKVAGYTGRSYSNCHQLASDGTKLYAIAGSYLSGYLFVQYDGSVFQDQTPDWLTGDVSSLALLSSDNLYLGIVNSAVTVYEHNGTNFIQLGSNVSPDGDGVSIAAHDGSVYTALCIDPGFSVRKRAAQQQPVSYTIDVSADPIIGGSVSGCGVYNKNASVSVTAVPNSGYNFVRWTEGGVEVSTSAAYQFAALANRSLSAVFEQEDVPESDGSDSSDGGVGGVSGGVSGGSGSGEPSDDSINVPISGEDETIHVGVSVNGTKATIDQVDLTKLNTVIGNEVQTGTVSIDFSVLDTEVDTVVIPLDVVIQISDAVNDPSNDAESLEILLSDGTSIEFDAAALGKKATQADGLDITISIQHSSEVHLTDGQKGALGERDGYDISVTSGGKHISDMGGKISVHAPYDLQTGEKAQGILVYYVDEQGNKEVCETSYDSVKKRVNWKTDHLSLYMIDYDEELANACPKDESCPIFPFTDTEPMQWYHDGVHFCLESGLMVGTDVEGRRTFEPNANTNRAMIVSILYRLEGQPTVTLESNFEDVAADQWYTDAVVWAVENGIAVGYGDGNFGPMDPITREQIAAFFYRMAIYRGMETVTLEENLSSFSDVDQISEYAIPAVQWACSAGIISGMGDGTLSPKDVATRAQVATILLKFV